MKEKISIIVPCYNEEEALPYFYDAIRELMEEMPKLKFEVLFVNDGSRDNTLEVIKSYAEKDKRIKYISFSRNFGKEAAIYAGFNHVEGDYITLMDADLQDPPKLLKEMYNYIKYEKYDMVGTRRVTRAGEPPIRSFFAKMFYRMINRMSKVKMTSGARDYCLMTRQVLNAIISMKEYNRYSKGLFSFVGFNVKWLEYENVKRVAGTTKWSFWKLFVYAIEGITAFSTVPLVISAIIGVIFFLVSLAAIIFIIIKTIIFGDPVGGWPSLACIVFLVSGIQLFCIGIMGQYLSKIYLELKERPIYIIKETNV